MNDSDKLTWKLPLSVPKTGERIVAKFRHYASGSVGIRYEVVSWDTEFSVWMGDSPFVYNDSQLLGWYPLPTEDDVTSTTPKEI